MCILHAEIARDIMTFADSTVPPSNVDLPKDPVNYGDELTPKPRKPYTITKQREKWTDEEHEKFLEALKLYGRAWRNIEEHVGTKTAIQIRSHAQKFFTKVVRESTGSSNPIEIPPPRPKRRPNHPYPRKLNVPAKSITPMQGGEGFDHDKESPTSVLSASGSDSHTYDFVNCSISSDTSTTGPTASTRCENSHEDKHSQAEQDDQTTLDDEQSMVQKNDATLTSFQLFGTLVIITSPQTMPSNCGGSETPASSPCQEIHPTAGKQATKPTAGNSNPSPAAADAHSHCSCGLLPFFYQEQGTGAPLTWLPFFGNPKKPFFANSYETPSVAAEAEESGTASNSSTEELCGRKAPLQSPKAKGFLPYKRPQEERGTKAGARGFLPYRQCLMEREEMQQQQESYEGREHQRLKLS